MKRIPFLINIDPGILADLRPHRRTIALGLGCVLITSLLDGLTIPLIERSFSAIQAAAPRAASDEALRKKRSDELIAEANRLGAELGIENTDDRVRLHRLLVDSVESADAARQKSLPLKVAAAFNVPVTRAESALESVRNKPFGDASALYRLGQYSLLVILLFAIKYAFTRGQAYYLSAAAAQLAADIRRRLFAKIQRLPVSFLGERRAGSVQSVLTNDVGVYMSAVMIIRDSLDAPVRIAIAFAFILYFQWQLAAVALVFLPLMALAIQRNGRKMKAAQSRMQDDLAEVTAMSTEAIGGHRVIKAFAAEDRIVAAFDRLMERSLGSQLTAARRTAKLRPLVELIGAGALAGVIFLCGWLSYQGQLQLGQIAALIFALDRINQGFRALGNVSNTASQVSAARERFHREILDLPEPSESERGTRTLADFAGEIEFDRVSFDYPDGTSALRDVSFRIAAGTSLALVGRSGAGKSTVTDLLLRFYEPTAGMIRLDGVDLRELDPAWLRQQFGVVPQQTFLFAGSIAENVRLGAPAASDDDLAWALRMAHAESIATEMAARESDVLGESGSQLSGGQRQRIAIARAIIRRPKLLILDEATSALDGESERAVTDALDEIMPGRTTVMVAHRLTTAARCSSILVLNQGQVVEFGTHAQLMEQNGTYAGLFRAFSGGTLG
ncbi:MAG: ABC transporter ATP-binding protein [Fimbriimonadaceae bacterium]|nr:ABC transporter ATP-binding protein [Fimbriimonadaceae bacterium]